MIRRAVIPAAGLGTRMRPISEIVPKELLPLGTKPAIQFAVDEALAAGIEQIVVVTSPGKGLLRDYLLRFGDPRGVASFELVTQEVPRGLGDAILCCREQVAGEPFALLLPDNVLLSEHHSIAPMIELHRESGLDVIGIIPVTHEESGRYGNCGQIDYEALRPRVLRLQRLYDKKPGTLQVPPGETVLRNCGRYVCTPRLIDELERLRPQTPGELDEVPAYQRIVADGGALGWVLDRPLFDVGNPAGYLAAAAELHRRG